MSQRSKIAAIIVTAGVVVLLSLAANYLMGRIVIAADDDVLRCHSIIGELHDVMSTLADAETGQRGYLLTGRENYLQPYTIATARFQLVLERLQARAKAGELAEREVTRLAQVEGDKLSELHLTIQLRRTQGLPAALAVVLTDSGKHAMDSIRALVAHMTEAQEAALIRGDQRSARFIFYRNLGAGLIACLNLAVLLLAYRQIRDESAGREQATLEISGKKTC
jgi:CHASE3 domain sensor protein